MIVASLSTAASGQSRQQVNIQTPGSLQKIGRGSTYGFRSYSYGTGSVGSSGLGSDSGILRSSIGSDLGAGSVDIRRSGGGGGLTNVASSDRSTLQTPQNVTRYDPLAPIGVGSGRGGLRTLTGEGGQNVGALGIYEDMFGSTGRSLLGGDEPIRSFADENDDSLRGEYMTKGEKLFREGRYFKAANQFDLAMQVSPRSPETRLSLLHVGLARSFSSYVTPALHLREALKVLPELPLADLEPKAFWGDTPQAATRYLDKIVELEQHAQKRPNDVDAHLLLAYFRWFQGEHEKAAQSLREALAAAENRGDLDALEVIDIFWNGMIRSGKIPPGELEPAEREKTVRGS
jgi:hypothetical protein